MTQKQDMFHTEILKFEIRLQRASSWCSSTQSSFTPHLDLFVGTKQDLQNLYSFYCNCCLVKYNQKVLFLKTSEQGTLSLIALPFFLFCFVFIPFRDLGNYKLPFFWQTYTTELKCTLLKICILVLMYFNHAKYMR